MAKKKVTRADEVDEDIVGIAKVIDELNNRLHTLELRDTEYTKLMNITTNTLNYVMASMFVYEQYLSGIGVDREQFRQEIDAVFYEVFNKNQQTSDGKKLEYNKNIIKRVNDKVREFQEKLNEIK